MWLIFNCQGIFFFLNSVATLCAVGQLSLEGSEPSRHSVLNCDCLLVKCVMRTSLMVSCEVGIKFFWGAWKDFYEIFGFLQNLHSVSFHSIQQTHCQILAHGTKSQSGEYSNSLLLYYSLYFHIYITFPLSHLLVFLLQVSSVGVVVYIVVYIDTQTNTIAPLITVKWALKKFDVTIQSSWERKFRKFKLFHLFYS